MSQDTKSNQARAGASVKIAGKKWDWPSAESGESAWSFERRPGGWILAVRKLASGELQRVRFYYSKTAERFSAKLTEGKSLDFFGEKKAAVRGQSSSAAESDYTAQFPGKVQKLKVSAGSEVEAGQPLLMVEAMKMEFAIKAASAGTVVRFLVEEGMILTPGQKLLEFAAKITEVKP